MNEAKYVRKMLRTSAHTKQQIHLIGPPRDTNTLPKLLHRDRLSCFFQQRADQWLAALLPRSPEGRCTYGSRHGSEGSVFVNATKFKQFHIRRPL